MYVLKPPKVLLRLCSDVWLKLSFFTFQTAAFICTINILTGFISVIELAHVIPAVINKKKLDLFSLRNSRTAFVGSEPFLDCLQQQLFFFI